jgi:hypothetical protein
MLQVHVLPQALNVTSNIFKGTVSRNGSGFALLDMKG